MPDRWPYILLTNLGIHFPDDDYKLPGPWGSKADPPKPGWSSFAGYTLLRRATVSSIYRPFLNIKLWSTFATLSSITKIISQRCINKSLLLGPLRFYLIFPLLQKRGNVFLFIHHVGYTNDTVFKNTDLHSRIILKPKYKRTIIKKKEKHYQTQTVLKIISWSKKCRHP